MITKIYSDKIVDKNTPNGVLALDVSGKVPMDKLGIGTPDISKFLKGDGSWQTISGGNPTGTIIYVASNNTPTGYLKANGAPVSRTTYSYLFASIGTLYGAGNGSTTFNLPDLRGYFLRSFDDRTSGGIDNSRTFGSVQLDDFKSHQHYVYGQSGLGAPGGGGIIAVNNVNNAAWSAITQAVGGTENRPKNIALLACIKY